LRATSTIVDVAIPERRRVSRGFPAGLAMPRRSQSSIACAGNDISIESFAQPFRRLHLYWQGGIAGSIRRPCCLTSNTELRERERAAGALTIVRSLVVGAEAWCRRENCAILSHQKGAPRSVLSAPDLEQAL
jgi:hypothetical protein